MRWWRWINGTTMGLRISSKDLVTVYLCIQIVINKMQLSSLFVACSQRRHGIWRWGKLLTHTTPYTLFAICPVQLKLGFIREEHTSPVAIEGEHLPIAVGSRPWWGQRACRWASLRRVLTGCAEILWLC
jgi:hypothetical protein